MKTQTSIDWLIEKLSTIDSHHLCEDGILDLIFNNARKMHREEVEEAYKAGYYEVDYYNDYYTKTFETP